METIDFDTARKRIEAVVAANPLKQFDWLDPDVYGCVYFNNDNTPCCIVGTAFEAELREAGVDSENPYNGSGVYILHQEDILRFTPKARRYLSLAQDYQDGGKTWAASAALAIEETSNSLLVDS